MPDDKISDYKAIKLPERIMKTEVKDLTLKDLGTMRDALQDAKKQGGFPGLCTCCSSS